MVAAKIPAITNPARRGGSRLVAKRMNTFSASEEVSSAEGYSERPTTPMNTAMVREITTQTVAILRDMVSSRSLRMAMNRSRTWGTPKYPKPHARADTTERAP